MRLIISHREFIRAGWTLALIALTTANAAEVRPDFQLVCTAGGTNNTLTAQGLAVDGAGNMYSGGDFAANLTIGATSFTNHGGNDIILVKYATNGALLWAKQLGSAQDDDLGGLAAESNGNLYVTGTYRDTLDFGGTVLTNASPGTNDVFVAKYDPSGNLLWATRIGGTGNDTVGGIALDAQTNVIVAGSFSGTANFGVTNQLTQSLGVGYLAKYDRNGNLLWAKNDRSSRKAVAAGPSGDIYVTVQFSGTMAFAAGSLTSYGSNDIALLKYDSSGNAIWSRQIGGLGNDLATGLAADASNNIFVAGQFYFTNTVGPTNLVSAGNSDGFLAKYDAGGSVLWAQAMGGTGVDKALSVTVDGAGSAYVSGQYNATALFATTNLAAASGNDDVFIAKYDAAGNFLWVNRLGGTGLDSTEGIAVDARTNLYVAGNYKSTASFGGLFYGGTNAFVARLAVTPRTTLGAARSLGTDMFGYNRPGTGSTTLWATDTYFDKTVAQNPGSLRIPAGTVGNYWEWQIGDQIPSNQLPAGIVGTGDKPAAMPLLLHSSSNRFDYQNLLLRTGATPIWMLNVLTRDTADQIAMLQYAQSLGLPITNLELGNEFYLSGNPDYVLKYPGPGGTNTNSAAFNYGLDCARWIAALRSAFSNQTLRIAVIGDRSGDTSTNPRDNNWNQDLVAALAARGQRADAITFHPYDGSSLADTNQVYDTDAPTMLKQPFLVQASFSDLAPAARSADMEFWMTEYNLMDSAAPVYGTWMHGLFAALKGLKLLEEPRVRFADIHLLYGNSQFASLFDATNAFAISTNGNKRPLVQPATLLHGQSASGATMQWVHGAAHWATSASPIIFASPIATVRGLASSGGNSTFYPALYGWLFTDGVQRLALVLNLSDQTLTDDFGGLIVGGGTFTNRYTSPATYVTGYPGQLGGANGVFSNRVTLPPYSISLLQAFAPPEVKGQLASRLVTPGDTATLYARPVGNPAPSCQWYYNGAPILGATNDSFSITNAAAGNTGNYYVVLSNAYGVVTSQTATLTVGTVPTVKLQAPLWNNGRLSFSVQSPAGGQLEILATTNVLQPLSNWSSLGTLTNQTGTAPFTDTPTNLHRRFYRARTTP